MRSRPGDAEEPRTSTSLGLLERRAAKKQRTRRRTSLALLVLAVLAVLTGLGMGLARGDRSGEGSGGGPANPQGEPKAGGTLTVAFQHPPASLDPAIGWDAESWSIERLTYQTLVTFAPQAGEAGTKLVPGLATTVPTVANGGISDGGRVYTFHLRTSARFAPPVDAPVTAADARWSFERMLKRPSAPATSFYQQVAGATAFRDGGAAHVSGLRVIDAHTLQFRLQRPDAAFLSKMALPFTSVMSKAWCAKVGASIGRRPLGSGPYVITSWTAGQITAARNPAFADQGVEGEQYVETMRVLLGADPSTALRDLEQGRVDVLGDGIPAQDHEATRASGEWGNYVLDAPQLAWSYLFMNMEEGYFRSSAVRRAVACAIDRRKIDELLAGSGRPVAQLYPAGLPGHQPGLQFYGYDPGRAKRLLAAADLPHGFTTSLYVENTPPQPQIAALIQRDLAAVGIKVSVVKLEPAVYATLIAVRRTHVPMGLANWYADFPDPSDWIGPLFTAPVDGGDNLSFYEDRQVTRLYEQSSRELDQQKRLQLFRRMQDIVMRSSPTVPLFQPVWSSMCGKDVGGFYLHPVWTFDFPSYWKLDGR